MAEIKCEICKKRKYTKVLKMMPLTLIGWKIRGAYGDILACDICYDKNEGVF